MGCGASKTSAVKEMEKRSKERGAMEAKKSKATEKKPNQESADSPDPDSQVDTNNNSNDCETSSKPRKASIHEEKMILHDWRKGTEDEMHKRIHAAREDPPNDSASRNRGGKSPNGNETVSKARTKASKARQMQRGGTGGDDADDESSDEESFAQHKPRIAAKPRKEPTLPGAVDDDDINEEKRPARASKSSPKGADPPLLAMFRPKSALNLDLD